MHIGEVGQLSCEEIDAVVQDLLDNSGVSWFYDCHRLTIIGRFMSPEQRLSIYLSFWINDPTKLTNKSYGKSKDEKLALLKEYQKVVAVKQKIVDAFKPRPGETDVFVVPFLGERLASLRCSIEKILTPEEIELLDFDDDEEDPVLEIFSEGYHEALRLIVNTA